MKHLIASLCLGLLAGLCGCTGAHPARPVARAGAATKITHATPAEAEALVRAGRVTVLDLRTPGEFGQGHIANARLVDFTAPDFAQQLAALDRSKPYLVHCASGGRSTKSLPVFEKLGVQSITHLDGGLMAWREAGKPVEK